jgi:hypothetical protein
MRMGRADDLAPSGRGNRKPPNRPAVLRRFHAVLVLEPERPIWSDCRRFAACEAAPDRLKPRVPRPGRGSAW